MKSIYLLRHGSIINPEKRIYGWRDVELQDPPEKILDIISSDWMHGIANIVSSDLIRCQWAAKCLSDRYGISLTISDLLREQSFGDWEGMTWDEVRRDDPVHWKRFFSDWIKEKPPKGESFLDMANRILAYSRQSVSKERTELWITHAGPIRVMYCRETGKPFTSAFDYQCKYYSTYHTYFDRI